MKTESWDQRSIWTRKFLLLPTRIGERFSQTVSNLGHAAHLRRCELSPINESAELTRGALLLILYSEQKIRIWVLMRGTRRTLFRSMSEKRAAVKCVSWARLARPTWRHRLSCSCASRSSAPCRLHTRYPPLSRPRHSSSPIYARGFSCKVFCTGSISNECNLAVLTPGGHIQADPSSCWFQIPEQVGWLVCDILICPVIKLLGSVADPGWIPAPDFYPSRIQQQQ